jgi:hypothetical protein
VFVEGLGTCIWSLSYDAHTRTGTIEMPEGSCTDISGAIALFTRIDPAVVRVITKAGGKLDTSFVTDVYCRLGAAVCQAVGTGDVAYLELSPTLDRLKHALVRYVYERAELSHHADVEPYYEIRLSLSRDAFARQVNQALDDSEDCQAVQDQRIELAKTAGSATPPTPLDVAANSPDSASKEVELREEITEDHDPVLKRDVLLRSSFADFRNYYLRESVRVGVDKHGDPIMRPLGHVWLTHRDRRQYEGVVMSPDREMPGFLNLWRGFSVTACPGSCEHYKAHLYEVICGGNTAL